MDDSNLLTTSTTRNKKRALALQNCIEFEPSVMSVTEEPPVLNNFCSDNWTWNKKDKSHEVLLYGDNFKTAQFHPNWSNGTAGVRGTRILNGGRYYWEIKISQRIFGTSMMFGIGTKKAKLHTNAFINLLGEDEQGWGLSHKGLLWHDGKWRQYTKPFRENESTIVGILFDGITGTLSYYKDGCCLGIAFNDLHLVQDELYPIICSTAAKTEMSLGDTKREFGNLQDRCRSAILTLLHEVSDVSELCLPKSIKSYLTEGVEELPPMDKPEKPLATRKRYNYFTRSTACRYVGMDSVPYTAEKYYS